MNNKQIKTELKKLKDKVLAHDEKQCWEDHNCLVEIANDINIIIDIMNETIE